MGFDYVLRDVQTGPKKQLRIEQEWKQTSSIGVYEISTVNLAVHDISVITECKSVTRERRHNCVCQNIGGLSAVIYSQA